jgi:hypothetical protein
MAAIKAHGNLHSQILQITIGLKRLKKDDCFLLSLPKSTSPTATPTVGTWHGNKKKGQKRKKIFDHILNKYFCTLSQKKWLF